MTRLILLLMLGAVLGGCQKSRENETATPAPPAAAAGPAAGNAAAPAANPGHQSALDKLTTTIVDRNQALAENPKLVELAKNELNATDPITYAGNAYFSAVSQIYVANLKHAVDLHKATNDAYPTFAEFEQMLRENNIKLQGLHRWQVYAYDDKTGAITILDDREMQREIYEKAGLEMPDPPAA